MSKVALLKDELAKPTYADTSHIDAALAINTPGSGADVLHGIEAGDLERYLAAEGIFLGLRDEADTGVSGDAVLTGVARELVAIVGSVNIKTFNIHHPRAMAGLDKLVAATVISPDQKNAIIALGTTAQTIGQQIGVGTVTADNVMRARTL